ncbi:MAG TPA: hypothetical protein VNL16_00405 [Chloroflexota bacterium]|nr:hypothetical protein [Chloroflexota bacterium]
MAVIAADRLVAETAGTVSGLWRDVEYGRFQRLLAVATAFFGALAGGEAFFEHLRGSFCQRVMWTPVWITPFVIAAGIGAAFSERIARSVLPLTAVVSLFDGLLGAYLHLRGVHRMAGGFRNFQFNFTMGPPLFAPLLFCAVGFLGLLAAILRRERWS